MNPEQIHKSRVHTGTSEVSSDSAHAKCTLLQGNIKQSFIADPRTDIPSQHQGTSGNEGRLLHSLIIIHDLLLIKCLRSCKQLWGCQQYEICSPSSSSFPFFERLIQSTATCWCGALSPLTQAQNTHAS